MAATTVADIMERDAPSIALEASVEEVIAQFKEQDVPALPVVNEGGRCVGVVTEKDLVIAGEDGDLHIPHYIELFGGLVFLEPVRGFERRLKKAMAATAKDLMTADPTTIGPDEDVHAAAKVISESGHNRLPVVEHGLLVGVITRADVLRALTDS
jgi:CBS domain-containing protein